MSRDQLIAEAIRLGTANLKEWQEYGKKWKARYDEMIETCRIAGNQRDDATSRVAELEDALNRIFHTTDCTAVQMTIIDEVVHPDENDPHHDCDFPQNASSFTWCRNAPSQPGRPRNIERESTRDPIGRGGEGESVYRCPRCLRNFWRKSDKAWIKSHCLSTGKDTRLIRLP